MRMKTKTEVTIEMTGTEALQLTEFLYRNGAGTGPSTPAQELLFKLQDLMPEETS